MTRLPIKRSAALTAFSLLAMASSALANAASADFTSDIADSATITVKVTGFADLTGQVMIALADEATYESGQAVAGTMVPVDQETVTVRFENVPIGAYAIRLFHDVDGDGGMNTNAFGIPTEPFAFSNNAAAVMGPAPWSAAQFELGPDGATQTISFE